MGLVAKVQSKAVPRRRDYPAGKGFS